MTTEYMRGWADALAEICEAYGGDPSDEAWWTPAGVAGIINELSGLARLYACKHAISKMQQPKREEVA